MKNRWYEGPLAALALTTVGDVAGDVDQVRITSATVVAMWQSRGAWHSHPYAYTVGADGQPPSIALEETVLALVKAIAQGVPIVVYDVAGTLAVLEAECRRNGALTLVGPMDTPPAAVCTKLLDRAVRPTTGPRSLVETCAYWGQKLDGQADATAIALASARTALEITRRYRGTIGPDIGDLQVRQRDWHNSQYRWQASRIRDQIARTEDGDEQLRLKAQAERAEAEASCWPLLHLPDQQGVLA